MVPARKIKMKDLDVNTATRGYIFMSVTLQAAFHLVKITQKICYLPRISKRNL